MDNILRFSGAVKHDPAVDLWFAERQPAFRSIAETWFARMRQCGDDVRELVHDGCPVACIDDAPFAYVNVFKDHVNVGFFYGAALDDPAGILEGNGKRMRHVKVKPGLEPNPEALNDLIDAAYLDINARLSALVKAGR